MLSCSAAKIEVLKCPKDPREWRQTFQIYPVGINEAVVVNLEMLCQCDCERPGHEAYIPNAPQCNFHGTYKCGVCDCDIDFFGPTCECDINNLKYNDDLERGCRPDNTTSVLCNNRGECICGECICHPREIDDEVNGQDKMWSLTVEVKFSFVLLRLLTATTASATTSPATAPTASSAPERTTGSASAGSASAGRSGTCQVRPF